MQLPNGQKPFEFVEIRFKNDRKLYYKNENNLSLSIGDVVAVEGNPGHDIGVVTLTGELVRIQMKKKAPICRNRRCEKNIQKSQPKRFRDLAFIPRKRNSDHDRFAYNSK